MNVLEETVQSSHVENTTFNIATITKKGNGLEYPFMDRLMGVVKDFQVEKKSFTLATMTGKELVINLTPTTFSELLRNLGEPYQDCTQQLEQMLVPGRRLFVMAVFYPENGILSIDAKFILFLGLTENEFLFEKQDWWIRQIRHLADFYLKAEFGSGDPYFREYQTVLGLDGEKPNENRQETATMSRLIYGLASAFLITGDDRYLLGAENGTKYLRDHLRWVIDDRESLCFWYHAIDFKSGQEEQVLGSEFPDDLNSIPAYEQIYALAGPVQTYRITGDPQILKDAQMTINMFNRYFLDRSDRGGYFSHVDPSNFNPYDDSLGKNKARKNWNSIGDHAPAYLINLWCATGDESYVKMLEINFDLIVKHFPDFENSKLVQERFTEDWSKDQTWGWQQNRGVVGHNLKIAWNLIRMHNLKPKPEYMALARKIISTIPEVGLDHLRGGWYDVLERTLEPGQIFHRFVWHDRKAWWQQEQAILAYYIHAGVLKDPICWDFARVSASFYNAWFLDNDYGGIFFNVLANGIPHLIAQDRNKGNHSMAGYHSFELCYLASVYINLLVQKQPMDFYFKPKPGGFKDDILRVHPDILPAGSVVISAVTINDTPYTNFDAVALTVQLPKDYKEIKVKVTLKPN